MKLKIFSAKSGKRVPAFGSLESQINAWLADHPNISIEHTDDLSQPNMNWAHLALAVWYTEE